MNKPERSRKRRILRLLGLLLLVYLVAGFVTRRVAWVPGTETHVARAALPDPPGVVVSGVSSIHTERSHDAVGSLQDVADAAAANGLDFVLVGDHPTPEGPAVPATRIDSVLIAFGDEIVIEETGRVLLFGLPAALDRRDWSLAELDELVTKRGGTAAIIHGRSPRERERWRIPEAGPAVAYEVIDVSETARRAGTNPWVVYHALALILGGITGQGDDVLTGLDRLGFEAPGVAAYDSLTLTTRLTALGGLNHHPMFELLGAPMPPYGPFFGTLVNHVHLGGPPPADPGAALDSIAGAIADGRVHFSSGESDLSAGFRFAAHHEAGSAIPMGRAGAWRPGLTLRTNHLPGRLLFKVVRDGIEVARRRGSALEFPIDRPGVYRVEVHRYAARIGDAFIGLRPWIFSNPVWIE